MYEHFGGRGQRPHTSFTLDHSVGSLLDCVAEGLSRVLDVGAGPLRGWPVLRRLAMNLSRLPKSLSRLVGSLIISGTGKCDLRGLMSTINMNVVMDTLVIGRSQA